MITEEDDSLDLIGTVVDGRYRIERLLGEGGMGTVYVAKHLLLGRVCALKTLRAEVARKPEVVKRFYREARAAALLGDDHIVEVTDMGHLPCGLPYIVMELLAGTDLRGSIQDAAPFSIVRAVDIALQGCKALWTAHQRGIVHRDIKPDNMFLTEQAGQRDFVKLLDFGISKVQDAVLGLDSATASLTRSGAMIGSPHYMAPEQLADLGPVDRRADIYALGVVLFEMLAGRVPFEASKLGALAVRILSDPIPDLRSLRPDVPAGLADAVTRALSKDVDARFPNMRAFALALEPFASLPTRRRLAPAAWPVADTEPGESSGGEQTSGTCAGAASTPTRPRGRRWIAGLLSASVLFGGLAAWQMQGSRGPAHIPPMTIAIAVRDPVPALKRSHPLPAGTRDATATEFPSSPSARSQVTHVHEAQALLATPTLYGGVSGVTDAASADHDPSSRRAAGNATAAPGAGRPHRSAQRRARSTVRPVRIKSMRRAAATVAFKCDGFETRLQVPARGTEVASLPSEDCMVHCEGLGQPKCMPRLSASSGWMVVR